MKCPNCGLYNPDSAQRCDCGYDFNSQAMKASYCDNRNTNEDLPVNSNIKTVYWIVIVCIFIANAWIAYYLQHPYAEEFYLLFSNAIGSVVGVFVLPFIAWTATWLIKRKSKPSLIAFLAIGGSVITVVTGWSRYVVHDYEKTKVELPSAYSAHKEQ